MLKVQNRMEDEVWDSEGGGVMKNSADFKQIARNALHGRWKLAVLTGFAAYLMGAEIAAGGNFRSDGSSVRLLTKIQMPQTGWQLGALLGIAVLAFVMWLIVKTVISGAGKLGYALFNLNLIDGKNVSFSDLFSQMNHLGDGFCMNFLMGLYTALWSLLFLIPGIVKSFSYAMTPYILAEHPEISPFDAITESRRIMDGKKWRLFCLEFSFLGWELLCAVPVLLTARWVIVSFAGIMFLRSYREAAYAAFYREISEK